MSVITIRLSPEEYRWIAAIARIEHRPISNFITTTVMKEIEETRFVDPIEMAQIKSDRGLMGRLKSGHRDVKKMKGRFVG